MKSATARSRVGLLHSLLSGGCFTLLEGFHCLALSIKRFEDSQQLGDLKQIADALREVGKLDVSARSSGRGVQGDDRTQAAAVNIADAAQVHHDVRLAFGDQALHLVAKCGGLVAKDDASIAGE